VNTKLLVGLLIVTFSFSLKLHAEINTDQLEIFSDKPLKQLYFRYTEGSLRNMPEAAWLKRWSRFDGIVLKAYAEEGAPFTQKQRDTLKLYKQTYPEKALLLHFNGRARDPLFQPIPGSARDFLYFSGTRNKSKISANETISKIYVEQAGVFRRTRSLPEGVFDDIVLVKVNSDKSLDWNQYEHAKLIEVNFENRFIRVKRDITNIGRVGGEQGEFHVAMHAAKGPFFAANKQRLWEYNWFAATDTVESKNTLQTSLVNFLSAELLTNNQYFDGVSIDVLTETRVSKVFGYSTLLDLDQDGIGDKSSSEFDSLHSLSIYQFLEKLRLQLSNKKLIIADGAATNQRAVGLLNGIESEGWPNFRDPELKQWSSGLNRQRYWNTFGQQPHFSYFKLAHYLDAQNKKIMPSKNARRLAVAAAMLTGAAISPAHRPGGVPFHKWPEFRVLKNLGKPVGEIQALGALDAIGLVKDGKAQQLLKKHLSSKQGFSEGGNRIVFKKVSEKYPVCFEIDHSGDLTISFEAQVNSQIGLPDWRPLMVTVSSVISGEKRTGLIGKTVFNSDFYFADFKRGEACISLDSESELSINNLQIKLSADIRYREFENGLLIANPSKYPIPLTNELLSQSLKESKYSEKLQNTTLPASNFIIFRL
jgi:hypothetical protein